MGKTLNFIVIGVIAVIIVAIAFGYRGGAKDATENYHKVMTGK